MTKAPISTAQKSLQGKSRAEAERAYLSLMKFAENEFGEASKANARAWWSLWLIYSRKLYLTHYKESDLSALEQWIGDLKISGWGPSRSTFFDYMGAIARWLKDGHDEKSAQRLLESPASTALIYDTKRLQDRRGKTLPTVQHALDEAHITIYDMTLTAAQLGPGEARQFVKAFAEQDIYYIVSGSIKQDHGKTRFTVRHENTRMGIIGEYSITVSGIGIAENGHKPKPLPQDIIEWMLRGKQ